ncbi:MAG: hypothetical protein IJI35_17875 [Kiritimatiellae bacterium]|nr:hypothetical protein [Kiritimatiellia bacterium]
MPGKAKSKWRPTPEQRRKYMARYTPEQKKAWHKRGAARARERYATDPEYRERIKAYHRKLYRKLMQDPEWRAKRVQASLKWRRTHRAWINNWMRQDRKKDPLKYLEYGARAEEKRKGTRLEYNRNYHRSHIAQAKAKNARRRAFDRLLMEIDADFYAVYRAKKRLEGVRKRARKHGAGYVYKPDFARRIPDTCRRGEVIDASSRFLFDNVTPAMREYVRQLRIERRDQIEGR